MRVYSFRILASPLAGLFLLLCGGPQVTKIKVAPVARTPNETPAEKSADSLYRGGLKAETSHDWAKASNLYAASAEKNPDRPGIWDSVGFAYEMSRQFDQAILAYERAIEKAPHEQYAYKHLGFIYETLGQYDSAIAELQKQLEMNAQDVESHQELANIYAKQRKFDLALSEFQAATQNMSPSPSLDLQRGVLQLGLHYDDGALASFRSALEHETDPIAPRAIALALADEGVHLDIADPLATLALHRAEAASNNTSLATINYDSARRTAAVAGVWDTMGWVRFAQGNMKAAEDYTRASWAIDDDSSSTAFHLGEIFAREGRRAEATRAYALSLSCDEPPVDARRELSALLGNGDINSAVAAAKTDLAERRAVSVPNPQRYQGTAEFWILLSPLENGAGSRSVDVKFISGSGERGKKLRKYTDELRSANLPYSFPAGEQTKLLVRGTLACSDANSSCLFSPYGSRQTLDILLASTRLQLPKGVHITMLPN